MNILDNVVDILFLNRFFLIFLFVIFLFIILWIVIILLIDFVISINIIKYNDSIVDGLNLGILNFKGIFKLS